MSMSKALPTFRQSLTADQKVGSACAVSEQNSFSLCKFSFMILSQSSADKMLRRMATEIAEHNFGKDEIIIIGIKESGTFIADKIEEYLREIFPGKIITLALGIDKKNPGRIELSEATALKGKIILLADDVANSGRTMLYAMQSFLQHYPAEIQTLALVESA